MKVRTTFQALVLDYSSSKSKDGQTTYYKVSLMDANTREAGTLSCAEHVALSGITMTPCECTAVYDNTYNPASFRVTDIFPVKQTDQKPGPEKK